MRQDQVEQTEAEPQEQAPAEPETAGAENSGSDTPPADPAPPEKRRGGPGGFWRRRDLILLVLVVASVLAAVVVVTVQSDVLATTSRTGPSNVPIPVPPGVVPETLREFWTAPSAATDSPVVQGPTVITADGSTVLGRDPVSGTERWRYQRDLALCTVKSAFGKIITVYQKAPYCSEMTSLDPTTGKRDRQRGSNAPLGTRLVDDGVNLTATGPAWMYTWRSDLVQTAEFGAIPFPVNPGKQPRVGCTYGSVAMGAGKIGVIERCPGDPGDRLTVYKANGKDADSPEIVFSTVVGNAGTRIVTINDGFVAVADPVRGKLLIFEGTSGNLLSEHQVDISADDHKGDPVGQVVQTVAIGDRVYWYTGSRVITLATSNFAPQQTYADAIGLPTVFSDKILVPTRAGLQVINPDDMSTGPLITVDRHGYTGPVNLAALGPVVLEQRGGTVAALR